uniref:Glycosyl transferase, group 1 family protein n=1 Tax=uncultured Thiotrichaceae bacterium TaxID=298394 RepID=A0A6S6UBX2_9GAMM|nr:MAG: Glycosyl transferase, group 1 family protein [uncultured Thiotrichaceae bacterium]
MKNIALVLKGYPRLSETFIAQEIHALEQRGMNITLVSLRHPTDKATHPIHGQIKAPVIYLPEYLYQEIPRVFKAWLTVRKRPHYKKAFKHWWRDLKRDTSSNRGRRFGQALVLAAEMPEGTEQLYAHFMHTPASVTRYASSISDIPWSCSAHAKDIWTSPKWDLSEKLEDMQWLATCTAANREYLAPLADNPAKVNLIYHGLDFNRFAPPKTLEYSQADGSSASQPVNIISVGRAVPKKGYDDLLTALSQLPNDYHWRLTHIGGGELLKDLQQQAEQLGIASHIQWLGSQPQEAVLAAYRSNDLFVLASKVVADGDRDGLPNVLMEAQSQGVCCLATDISGIPELLQHEVTGLMVPAERPDKLTEQLQRLITQPELRRQLGTQGKHYLRQNFSLKQGIDHLVDLFQQ